MAVFCVNLVDLVFVQLIKLNDELNQCKLYLLSIDAQRILVIFMTNTQNPRTIRGCGKHTTQENQSKR